LSTLILLICMGKLWLLPLAALFFLMVPPVEALVDHGAIVVEGDSGLVSGGFPGSGTRDDPYRIEGFHVVTDSLHRNGVEVRNTEAYFVVRGCLIEADYIGVLVEGAAPGTAMIVDNVVMGRAHEGGGISLSSDRVVVVNNTCSGFVVGVHTNYADGCVFQYNNFSYNTYHGLNIRYSDDCLITCNTVMGNGGHGIFIIRDSKGNRIYNNTVAGNGYIGSYEWDDIYSYDVSSQGCDEGAGNIWYDEESKTGNRWSDYTGIGEYLIDGSAGSVDKYPVSVEAPTGNPPKETGGGVPAFSVLSVVLGVLLLVIYRRYRCSNRCTLSGL
jgi:parallel beta-helix repeat protein